MRTETLALQKAVADALGLELVRCHDGTGREAATWSYLDLETWEGAGAVLEAMRARGWSCDIEVVAATPGYSDFNLARFSHAGVLNAHQRQSGTSLPDAVLYAAAAALNVG